MIFDHLLLWAAPCKASALGWHPISRTLKNSNHRAAGTLGLAAPVSPNLQQERSDYASQCLSLITSLQWAATHNLIQFSSPLIFNISQSSQTCMQRFIFTTRYVSHWSCNRVLDLNDLISTLCWHHFWGLLVLDANIISSLFVCNKAQIMTCRSNLVDLVSIIFSECENVPVFEQKVIQISHKMESGSCSSRV